MNKSSEFEETVRDRFIRNNHFPRLLGIELDSIGDGEATLSLEVSDKVLQLQGIMHGGAIASLIDTAVAVAIATKAEPGELFTTVELKVNYLSPISRGRAIARATLVKKGRRIVVAECDVTDSAGKLLAKGLLTYITL